MWRHAGLEQICFYIRTDDFSDVSVDKGSHIADRLRCALVGASSFDMPVGLGRHAL